MENHFLPKFSFSGNNEQRPFLEMNGHSEKSGSDSYKCFVVAVVVLFCFVLFFVFCFCFLFFSFPEMASSIFPRFWIGQLPDSKSQRKNFHTPTSTKLDIDRFYARDINIV